MMNERQLRDYSNWVGNSAKDIRDAVIKVGGWANVFSSAAFPRGLPLWAHRIRNYFNREPASLMRLDAKSTERLIERVDEGLGWHPAEMWALTDDVYKDAQSWVWYQMNEGGTIYHWGAPPRVAPIEAGWQEIKEKVGIPAPRFKLVAPDGTGGSRETILRNLYNLFTPVKQVNFMADVSYLVITDFLNQGSYNYAETIKAGYSAHKKLDMETHEKAPDKYVNPPGSRFSPLSQRIFPDKAPGESNPLADQLRF
jgi:hypothetical protein